MRIGKSQSVLDEGEGKEKRQIKSTVNKDEITIQRVQMVVEGIQSSTFSAA